MEPTEQMLYIIILEQKPRSIEENESTKKPIRSIRCVTPDTKALLSLYATTYDKFYWCNEFSLSSANKKIIFFDIYQKLSHKKILTEYLNWFGEIMGRFVSYASSFIAASHGRQLKESFAAYIRLTLSKKTDLWNAIKKAFGFNKSDEMVTVFQGIVHSLYYIATKVMGYELAFDVPYRKNQDN